MFFSGTGKLSPVAHLSLDIRLGECKESTLRIDLGEFAQSAPTQLTHGRHLPEMHQNLHLLGPEQRYLLAIFHFVQILSRPLRCGIIFDNHRIGAV